MYNLNGFISLLLNNDCKSIAFVIYNFRVIINENKIDNNKSNFSFFIVL